MVSPKYDVLPLIRRHFEHRLADQQWVIYDTRRGYGMFFDRLHTRIIRMDIDTIQPSCAQVLNDESLCQTLWKRYYQTASIAARSNPRLHLRQLPRRFWRYLPEKQVSSPFKTKRRGRPKRVNPLDTRSEFDCKRNTV
jgi:probable DNA metabolism protein